MSVRVLHGDCLDILPTLEAESFHSVCCDPPYHLTSIVDRFGKAGAAPAKHGTDGAYARASRGFMGKQWDGGDIAFRPETWVEVFRVMKPGAHLAAFGGSRTYHRMACAIEDAGFEIRDTLCWLYGSGFPKSHDVSKGIDKAAGAEGKFGAKKPNVHSRGDHSLNDGWKRPWMDDPEAVDKSGREYAPATPEAAQWAGWGTALKPAYEPIILARKPLIGTVAGNTLKHGVGGINIDACRVEGCVAEMAGRSGASTPSEVLKGNIGIDTTWEPSQRGRWPANVLHDGSPEVMAAFAAYGEKPTGKPTVGSMPTTADVFGKYNKRSTVGGGDVGSAARFFYSSKADSDDRAWSKHPTVKPIDLIRWLSRLITPPGGHVLDLFAGSGTTGEAALLEGFNVTLIEREAEYIADIHRRLGRASGADTPLFA